MSLLGGAGSGRADVTRGRLCVRAGDCVGWDAVLGGVQVGEGEVIAGQGRGAGWLGGELQQGDVCCEGVVLFG